MIRSYVSSTLMLILFVLIETALLSNISFLPIIPDFMMICVLYFSIRNGKIAGQTTGFISGLLLDFLCGTPFGMSCLVRVILGYLGGLFHNLLNYKSFFVNFVIGFCATLVKVILIYFLSLFFPNYVNSYHLFSSVFALELLANTILTPLIFNFLGVFDSFILLPDRRLG